MTLQMILQVGVTMGNFPHVIIIIIILIVVRTYKWIPTRTSLNCNIYLSYRICTRNNLTNPFLRSSLPSSTPGVLGLPSFLQCQFT